MKLKWYMKYDKKHNAIKMRWLWVLFQYLYFKL